MKKCIIFCGGEFDAALPDGFSADETFVIAADKGFEYCGRLGITPQLTIGDLDSLGYEPNGCETAVFPKEKDDTDLMLAVRRALSHGCKDITLLCALGGRMDHFFANLQTLSFIVSHGAHGRMISSDEHIELYAPQKISIPYREGFSMSVFSYGEAVSGLSISGTKNTLCGGGIASSFPIGVSNEITSERAEISFDEGLLLIIQSRI